MNPNLEKSSDSSRGLLFGLRANGIFSTDASEDYPLWDPRNSFIIEQKHKFVMRLTGEEGSNILAQHEKFYEIRVSQINRSIYF
jgi:hypothetical protein